MPYNSISGITGLAGIESLKVVDLRHNEITDLSPLVANSAFGAGDFVNITGNPLSNVSINTHIPALRARGASVWFDEYLSFEEPKVFNDNVVVLPLEGDEDTRPVSTRLYAELFYEHFRDEFDFLIFLPKFFGVPKGGQLYTAVYDQVDNDVSGIGKGVGGNNLEFTNRLQGMVLYAGAKYDIDEFEPERRSAIHGGDVLVHELAHRWGVSIIPSDDGHWGFSSADGVLGGFDIAKLIDHGNGIYTAGRFRTYLPYYSEPYDIKFSPIELYLAGLIPANEVPDLWVALDGEWLNDEDAAKFYNETGGAFERPFGATQVRTYTIEDIIAEHGPRVPSAEQSQKNFRAAVVHLVDDDNPTTSELIAQISKDATRFSERVISVNNHSNFYEATGGRGTITLDGLSQAWLGSEDSLLVRYDANENGRIDLAEAVQAVNDYAAGKLSIEEVVQVVQLYSSG